MLVISCRFSADDAITTVSNARALHQKPTESRETSTPKPSDSDEASGQTKKQPPDAQSSAQKALSGVPTHYTPYYTDVCDAQLYLYVNTHTVIAHFCMCLNPKSTKVGSKLTPLFSHSITSHFNLLHNRAIF